MTELSQPIAGMGGFEAAGHMPELQPSSENMPIRASIPGPRAPLAEVIDIELEAEAATLNITGWLADYIEEKAAIQAAEPKETQSIDDQGLVDLVRAGQTSYYGALFGRHYSILSQHATDKFGVDGERAVSEAFVRGLAYLQNDRPINCSNLTGAGLWFKAVAERIIIDEAKSANSRVRVDTEQVDKVLDATVAPADDSSPIPGAMYMRLIDSLSTDQRDVMRARAVDGLSLRQTAELLGRSVPAVQKLQERGRANLVRVTTAMAAAGRLAAPEAISLDLGEPADGLTAAASEATLQAEATATRYIERTMAYLPADLTTVLAQYASGAMHPLEAAMHFGLSIDDFHGAYKHVRRHTTRQLARTSNREK